MRGPQLWLALGALAVGLLDGADALIFFGLRGVEPRLIAQSIASGLLGPAAFRGGAGTILLGIVLHFCVAASIVGTCYAVVRLWPGLARNPIAFGIAFGLVAYAVMNFVVVPLSNAAGGAKPASVIVNGLLIHALGVGIPSALAARAALRSRGT